MGSGLVGLAFRSLALQVPQAVRRKWTGIFSELGKAPHAAAEHSVVRNQACCQGQRAVQCALNAQTWER